MVSVYSPFAAQLACHERPAENEKIIKISCAEKILLLNLFKFLY